MGDDQEERNEQREERIVVAFELMAEALKGIYETEQKRFLRQFPEPKEMREAVVTRVPTEEDRIRELHGASDEPIEEWIGFSEEYIGTREKEFLEAQARAASAKPPLAEGPDGAGAEAPESKA